MTAKNLTQEDLELIVLIIQGYKEQSGVINTVNHEQVFIICDNLINKIENE
jgi:hypothetical protein